MQHLVESMSRLMKVCNKTNHPLIPLPKIAVVGSQSSGKSSVLEAFVGQDFLPRGSGIVTRCPLQLTLVNDPSDTSEHGVGIFDHDNSKTYTNFDEIRKGIEARTAERAGPSKNVVDKPIYLEIKSKSVPNLIVIDLPGLTKNPVGDQPQDISDQIKNMVEKYIKDPQTIILAISGANQDIATSDGIKFARKYDPRGERTLGVLTKVDIATDQRAVANVLAGREINLALGFIGVRLRSDEESKRGITIEECRDIEREFFENSPDLYSVSSHCGVGYLTDTLTNLLLSTLKSEMATITSELRELQKQTNNDLEKLGGEMIYTDPESRRNRLNEFLRLFTDNYKNIIDGKLPQEASMQSLSSFSTSYFSSTQMNPLSQTQQTNAHNSSSSSSSSSSSASLNQSQISPASSLRGGSRFRRIFQTTFATKLADIKVDFGMSEGQLRTFMHNSEGLSSSLYVPENCFFQLVRRQIDRIRPIVTSCVELCYKHCMEITNYALDYTKGIVRFPKLRLRLSQEVQSLLNEWKDKTLRECLAYVDIERSFINTKHPRFQPAESLNKVLMTQRQAAENQVLNNAIMAQRQGQRTPPPQRATAPINPSIRNAPPMFLNSQASVQQPVQPVTYELNLTDEVKEKLIYNLVTEYFSIVTLNITDIVPKTIVLWLINYSRDSMLTSLLMRLSNIDIANQLIVEEAGIAAKRKLIMERQDQLSEAISIVEDLNQQTSTTAFGDSFQSSSRGHAP